MYKLEEAKKEHIELLIKYKLSTILEYAADLNKEEIKRIEDYVNSSVLNMLNYYKIITINNNIVGCLLLNDYEDGVILDEIYLEYDVRGKGIGSSLLRKVLNKHNVVYLWVYKKNKEAIKLYEKFNFKVINETESRYFMKYDKEIDL